MTDINIKIVIPERGDRKAMNIVAAIKRILGFAKARIEAVEKENRQIPHTPGGDFRG